MKPEAFGPRTAFGQIIHAMKYRSNDEKFDDYCVRYSRTVTENEKDFRRLLHYLRHQVILPAGRQQLTVGRPQDTTAFNCFCMATIPDDTVGIFEAVKEAALTLRSGGGVGMDFSSLRPEGEPIRGLGFGARSSGPVSFMNVWNAMCGTIMSAGERRGAMMGTLRCDHPSIMSFIRAKQKPGALTNFNISVTVTDEFMEALENDGSYKLKFGETSFGEARAVDVWAAIMESNFDHAEPGILFIDRINQLNPLSYCEKIDTTNPCFASETLIVTDKGAMPIEELVGMTANIWDGSSWRLIDNFRETGQNQPMLKITLQDGSSLRVTHAHTIIKEDGRRLPAQELRVGDSLLLSDVTYDGDIDEPGAYLKGFLLGDGCLRGGGRLQPMLYLYEPKYVCRERLIGSAREITPGPVRTNAIATLGFIDQEIGDDHKRQVMTGLAPRGEELRDWCSVYKDNLPNISFRWTHKTKTEFLAGLFDADGTAMDTSNGFGYQLSSISYSFLEDVQTLLKSIGVRSKLTLMRRGGLSTSLPGRAEGYITQDCWRLTIAQAAAIHLAKITPFERLRSFAMRHSVYNVKSRAGRIVAIEEDGIDDIVYCCTVPETHRLSIGIGITTGQCSEQPLPPYGACLLGSINLVKVLVPSYGGSSVVGIHGKPAVWYSVDWELLDDAVDAAVRAFDMVIDRTSFPLEQQRQEALQKRRMGVGVTGVANALEIMGLSYASEGYLEMQDKILSRVLHRAYRTSMELACEKEPFPLWNRWLYGAGEFFKTRIPDDLQDEIKCNGLRNGLLTSIAPTGTISMTADNISSGIEPVFSHKAQRTILTPEGPKEFEVTDYAYEFHGVVGKTAAEVSPQGHVDVLCRAQQWVDSSISKTINVTGQVGGKGPGITFAEFKGIYLNVWKGGGKGAAVFNATGKRAGIIVAIADKKESEGAACFFDPETGVKSCAD